jgi:hypothetical protein
LFVALEACGYSLTESTENENSWSYLQRNPW